MHYSQFRRSPSSVLFILLKCNSQEAPGRLLWFPWSNVCLPMVFFPGSRQAFISTPATLIAEGENVWQYWQPKVCPPFLTVDLRPFFLNHTLEDTLVVWFMFSWKVLHVMNAFTHPWLPSHFKIKEIKALKKYITLWHNFISVPTSVMCHNLQKTDF